MRQIISLRQCLPIFIYHLKIITKIKIFFKQTEQGLTAEQGLAAQQTAVINLTGVGGFMPSQTGVYTHKVTSRSSVSFSFSLMFSVTDIFTLKNLSNRH